MRNQLQVTNEQPARSMSHPFLRGLGVTLLLSFAYAFVFLTSA
jgi:hypothetical protein